MSEIPNEVKKEWMENVMELKWQMLNTNWSSPVDSSDVQGMELPVLLVAGDSSPEFLIAIQQQLDRFLPNSEYVTLTNSTHGLHHNNPEQFNREVLGFINEH